MNFETFNADDTFDLDLIVDEIESHQPEQTEDEGEQA